MYKNEKLEWECLNQMVENDFKRIYHLEKLNEKDFACIHTKNIFKCLYEAVNKSNKIDILYVSDWMTKQNLSFDITKLMKPSLTLKENVAHKLRELTILRHTHLLSLNLTNKLVPNANALTLIDDLKKDVNDIHNISSFDKKQTLSTLSDNALDIIADTMVGDNKHILKTGFGKYDDVINGYRRGQMIVVAGRPGMGKSTQIYTESILFGKQGKRVVIISLEILAVEVTTNLLCNLANVDSMEVDKGTISKHDFEKLEKAKKELDEMDIHILELSNPKLEDIELAIKKINMEKQIDVGYLDYIQLMRVSGNITESVTKNSQGLKQLAKSQEFTFVVLSQLSRNVEQRTIVKIPMLSDLRDSGAIEQDADKVVFVYRPEYYGEEEISKAIDTFGTTQDLRGMVVFIVAKNRKGRKGNILLHQEFRFCRFTDKLHKEEVKPKLDLKEFRQDLEDIPF